jgi:NADP-dependent 3-hydroxy acid dehydrogenase YdfG
MSVSNNIAGKVVIITGASSGLGEATARHLAKAGAKLVLAARRLERIEQLAAELTAAGGQAIAVKTDVTVREDLQALAAAAVEHFGRVDVLVNNAGTMPLAPINKLKVDEWDYMIDVNIKGVLYGIAAALPHMQARKSGHIVNVSSVAGHKVRAGTAVYSATKRAVRVLTEGLRQEVKPWGIRTTIISPGAVATELPDSITEADVQAGVKAFYEIAIPAESFARAVVYALGQPEDVDINEILFRPTKQEY